MSEGRAGQSIIAPNLPTSIHHGHEPHLGTMTTRQERYETKRHVDENKKVSCFWGQELAKRSFSIVSRSTKVMKSFTIPSCCVHVAYLLVLCRRIHAWEYNIQTDRIPFWFPLVSSPRALLVLVSMLAWWMYKKERIPSYLNVLASSSLSLGRTVLLIRFVLLDAPAGTADQCVRGVCCAWLCFLVVLPCRRLSLSS